MISRLQEGAEGHVGYSAIVTRHERDHASDRGDELVGGWSWATPAVAADVVYIGAISAHPYYFEGVTLERGLHAVDRRTGTLLWRFPTRALPGFVTGGVFSRPLILDDRVIFGALDHRVYAVRR